MADLLSALFDRAGKYRGEDVNHAGDAFVGELGLAPLGTDDGVMFAFRATGKDGEIFHEEGGLIVKGTDGVPVYQCVSSSNPVPTPFPLQSSRPRSKGADGTLVFRSDDTPGGTVELIVDLWPDGDISARWFWGKPFQQQSGVRMKETSA